MQNHPLFKAWNQSEHRRGLDGEKAKAGAMIGVPASKMEAFLIMYDEIYPQMGSIPTFRSSPAYAQIQHAVRTAAEATEAAEAGAGAGAGTRAAELAA